MIKSGKGKGMGYSGGKHRGGRGITQHSEEPRKFQTRTESSKSMGIHYMPPGMREGKVDCSKGY